MSIAKHTHFILKLLTQHHFRRSKVESSLSNILWRCKKRLLLKLVRTLELIFSPVQLDGQAWGIIAQLNWNQKKSIWWKKTRNVWSFPLFGWNRIASDSLIYICLNIAVIELSLMWRLILANFPYYLDTIYWWYRANIGLRIMYEEKLIIGPQ